MAALNTWAARPPENSNALRAALILMAVGAVVLRLHVFAGGRSLWVDEAMVAISLIYLPFSGLFGDLPLLQMAPVAWLLAERLIFEIWPSTNFGLRIVSLVGGLLSVWAFASLARSALPPAVAVFFVASLAISPEAIRYSAMVKPYIWDLAVGCLIMLSGILMLRENAGKREMSYFLALGSFAVLFTFGALIVLASTGLILATQRYASKQRGDLLILAVVGFAWVLIAMAQYIAFYAGQAVSEMQDAWNGGFGPPPLSISGLSWYVSAAKAILWFFFERISFASLIIAMILGAWYLLRTNPWLLALCMGPFVIALAASFAHAYPLAPRLHFALLPVALLLASFGLIWLSLQSKPGLVGACLLAALGLGPQLVETLNEAMLDPPWATEEADANLAIIASRATSRDTIIVTPVAEYALLIYASDLELAPTKYVVTSDRDDDMQCAGIGLDALPNRGTAWFLTYHERHTRPMTAAYLRQLSQRGRVTLVSSPPGSALYRVRLLAQQQSDASTGPCRDRESRPLLRSIAAKVGLRALN